MIGTTVYCIPISVTALPFCAVYRPGLPASASALPIPGSGMAARMAPMKSFGLLARAGALVKEQAFPEARGAFAIFYEGGVSAIELPTFLDRELPDWLATIDPVNLPALKNAEICGRANI